MVRKSGLRVSRSVMPGAWKCRSVRSARNIAWRRVAPATAARTHRRRRRAHRRGRNSDVEPKALLKGCDIRSQPSREQREGCAERQRNARDRQQQHASHRQRDGDAASMRRVCSPRTRPSPARRLSTAVAKISTPGVERSNDVAKRSPAPAAVTPSTTVWPARSSSFTLPATTSAALKVRMLPSGP